MARTSPSRPQKVRHLKDVHPHVVLEFGDLGIEANRVRYIEAMILNRVLPGYDADSERLEAAFLHLPRGTMNQLVATFAKLDKARRKSTALILKRFHDRYVP